jgi:hypothetical protein
LKEKDPKNLRWLTGDAPDSPQKTIYTNMTKNSKKEQIGSQKLKQEERKQKRSRRLYIESIYYYS